jgi:integrase/recombinase XerD
MTRLDETLADYLTVRRALGYKLVRHGKLLAQFVAYLDEAGADTVTIEHALAWSAQPRGGDVSWWMTRLSVVRCFARWLHTIDPRAEVPPVDLLIGPRIRRVTPFLYTDAEIRALIDAAGILRGPLRTLTFRTLIGLLAVTGIRIGEAIRLDRGDLDLELGTLTIRDSKFGKSRELPLHSSTSRALRDYMARRDELFPVPSTPAVFISTAGTRLLYCGFHWTWLKLVAHAGLTARSAACRPRPHDVRHAFAVRTILDAYHAGGDVDRQLSLLCTYLGHGNPGATYWYLSAAPELLALAAERLQRHEEAR